MNRSRSRMMAAAILIAGSLVSLRAAGDAFDRWAAALGGRDRLSTVTAVSREATIDIAGYQGTIKAWHTAEGKYRKEERVANVSTVETFDGVRGWLKDGAAQPVPLEGADLVRTRSMPYANWNAAFFALFPSRHAGTRTGDGDAIVFCPEGGIDWRVTLDPGTGLPATMVHQEGARTVTVTFVSYETINGIAFEKEIRRSNGNAQFNAVIRFTKTEINPVLPPALFTQAAAGDQP
jgi:hypothetical protein